MASDWYAVAALDGLVDRVKAFLLPFDRGVWLRMAVIVFFIGGSASFQPPTGFDGGAGDQIDTAQFEEAVSGIPFEELVTTPFIVAAIIILFVVILGFSYLSAVFEFIFYQALEEGDPRLRDGLQRYARTGFWYFLVNWVLLLAGVIPLLLVIGGWMVLGSPAILALGILMAPVWIALWLVSFVITNIAVPGIVVEDLGFMDGLRNAYKHVRAEWQQAGIYLLARMVMGIAAAITTGLGMVAALIVLAIPLALIGVPLFLVNPALVAIPVVIGIVGLVVAWFAVSIPVQTFVHQWILDVYDGFAG